MKRDTISGASHKAQLGSMSRGTMRKMDHSTVIPTADMDVMHGETSKGVPVVQPYGFSYWPMEQSEESGGGGSGGGGGGSKQPQGKSAMGLTSYANGTRSDPSSQGLQDPRHHMMLEDEKQQGGGQQGGSGGGSQQESKGGKAGDVALYRTNDKDKLQQFHLTDEGPRLTSIQTMKFALVEAEQDQQSGGQGSAGGGASGSGGQSSQSGQSSKADGQRPIFKKESKKYIEQTTSKTTAAQGDGHAVVEDKKVRMRYKDDDISAMTTDKHVHIRYKDYRVFVDESGCWSTHPIQVKADPDSSSAGASAMHMTLSESELRWRDIMTDPGRVEMATLLQKFSGETIDSWVDANVTNFEQLKDMLKALLKALART